MDIYNKIKEKFMDSPRSVESKEDKEKEKGDEKVELEPICLLFPTYATRNPDGQSTDEWKIRIRGWAFSAPKKSKTRSIFLGLTSLALQKDDERFQYLESRTSYFWTSNADQGDFIVQVEGLTDSNKMTIEGDPNDSGVLSTTVEPHGEGSTLTTAKFNVPDVNKVISQTGKMISAQFQSGIETIQATITPKSGHFFGNLSVQKDIVVNWLNDQNSETVVGGFISSVVGSKDLKTKDKDKSRLLKIKVFKDGSDPHYGVVNLVEPEGVSIISDIDDTIKDTNILHGAKKVLSNTFLQPFKDVPGMSDVYRNFHDRGAAIHYVSNSPWQLFPSLRTFFDTYNFPPGSAHFKFYDGLIKSAYEQKENPMASKFKYIRELLKDFPNRKFILIGDTGELDPEIYTTIARENPGRILRIYVRDVTTDHVKDLPPQKPKHSYTQTFPTIYNYLRNHYSGDETEETETGESSDNKKAEDVADHVITQQAAAATSGETTETITDPKKPERKSSLTNRLLDKLHVDMSYLYGTAMTDSPDSIDSNSTTSKPKTPLSAKLLSPERAASMSSKFSKLRSSSSDKSGSADKTKDDGSSSDEEKDKDSKEELKTPLQMYHERCQLLRQDLPDDLFHLFTDAKEIENDPVIRKELNYSE